MNYLWSFPVASQRQDGSDRWRFSLMTFPFCVCLSHRFLLTGFVNVTSTTVMDARFRERNQKKIGALIFFFSFLLFFFLHFGRFVGFRPTATQKRRRILCLLFFLVAIGLFHYFLFSFLVPFNALLTSVARRALVIGTWFGRVSASVTLMLLLLLFLFFLGVFVSAGCCLAEPERVGFSRFFYCCCCCCCCGCGCCCFSPIFLVFFTSFYLLGTRFFLFFLNLLMHFN